MSRSNRRADGLVVTRDEVIRFVSDSLAKVGASGENARAIAEHLFTADYRGHFSHGLNRLELYVKDARKNLVDPEAQPEIVSDTRAVALVDGRNGYGHVAGNFCMRLAMRKAKEFGIGMVSCGGSNHFGIAGYYALMAMSEDLIGFACTNTSPLMAPTRSRAAALGSNPIAFGAAALGEDQFVLDMATTSVALGKIEVANRKGERIPTDWALGADGKPTSNAGDALRTCCLLPLGGEEMTSGYKGYGLALMVEILCGVLTGGDFGPNIRNWMEGTGVANLSHCFVAIDPEKFVTGSKERLSDLIEQLRGLPAVGEGNVLVAGDPEIEHMRKVDREGGISYHVDQIDASEDLARELGVEAMRLVAGKN